MKNIKWIGLFLLGLASSGSALAFPHNGGAQPNPYNPPSAQCPPGYYYGGDGYCYPQQQPSDDDRRNYVCTTFSRGRSFSLPGRGYWRTRAKVIESCVRDGYGYTNYYECESNARCQ